jgi:hypothetical protein
MGRVRRYTERFEREATAGVVALAKVKRGVPGGIGYLPHARPGMRTWVQTPEKRRL